MNQPEIEQIGEELYFVAASPATRRLRTQAELLSQTDVPVLITGEGGSGKATVQRHKQKEVRVIVSPVPYAKVARLEYASGWRTEQ